MTLLKKYLSKGLSSSCSLQWHCFLLQELRISSPILGVIYSVRYYDFYTLIYQKNEYMYQLTVMYNSSIEFPIFGTDDTVDRLKGIYTILFIYIEHLKPLISIPWLRKAFFALNRLGTSILTWQIIFVARITIVICYFCSKFVSSALHVLRNTVFCTYKEKPLNQSKCLYEIKYLFWKSMLIELLSPQQSTVSKISRASWIKSWM